MSKDATASAFVTVGCKLPHGLVLELKSTDGTPVRQILLGANASRIVGGYGITENVPTEYMMEWLRKNAKHSAVIKGHVFIHDEARSAERMAKERRDVKTGFEAINPVNAGMLKNEHGIDDPEALKAYNTARAKNPERNRQRVE